MWQLNEIWPTGGWGSLEYGTPVKGQVIGGRWKPLHHMMEQSAYTDVTAACGKASITVTADNARSPAPHRIARRLTHCWRLLDARTTSLSTDRSLQMMDADDDASGPAICYVRNDLPTPFTGSVTVAALSLEGGKSTTLSSIKVSLPAGQQQNRTVPRFASDFC